MKILPRSRTHWFLTVLFFLMGSFLLLLAFLPGGTLKTQADGLMPDQEFEALNSGNVIVFRCIFAAGALAFIACATVTYFQRWGFVPVFLKSFRTDTCSSLRWGRISRHEIPFLLAVLLMTAATAVIRLEFITSALHHDEAYTYMAFAHSLRSALTDYHLPNNHVFHSILVYVSTHLLGAQPWAVRLPAFTAGVLLTPAIYALGKQHYSRWVGSGAALLVALSPAMVAYSDNARGYTLVALLGVLLLLLGQSVLKAKNRFAWALIALLSALGMFTIPAFLFPFGILFLWLLLENRSTAAPGYKSRLQFLKYWLASGLSSAALTLMLYLPILLYSGPASLFSNDFVSPVPWRDFLETISHRLVETWYEWTFRVPAAAILLLVAGLVLSLVFHRKISSTRIPLQLAAGGWIMILLLVQRPNAWSKIWVYLLPLVILWAAAGLFGLLDKVKVRSTPGSALAAALLFVLVLGRAAWLLPQLPEIWAIHGDEENAVLFVQSQMVDGDKLVVSPPDDAPVWYYAELHDLSGEIFQQDSDFTRLFVLVDPAEGQSYDSVLDERGPGRAAARGCALLKSFGKIQVFLCQEEP